MKKAKRVFVIVLDSFGIGYEPDAELFGDVGANTLSSIARAEGFLLNTMRSLGLYNIDGVTAGEAVASPLAAHARLREKSMGKDTTVGHWELMGVISERPLPTYPDGFPAEVLDAFSQAVGRGVLCNKPYSGTDVIRDYGDAHVASGDLIVYTSADSVFQIAAHEEIVPIETLYDYCRIARKILVGEHGVGRVIARPFTGESGSYRRTANRHDFSLEPPTLTVLDELKAAGKDVIAVGKITDIFAGKGVTESMFTHSNDEGMAVTKALSARDFNGLCFTNLVDFDMLYGHRQDVKGYAEAMMAFDVWLEEFLPTLSEEDVLVITADHGCDPADQSTDHTREYVPMLIYGKGIAPRNLGTLDGFDTVGKTVKALLGL